LYACGQCASGRLRATRRRGGFRHRGCRGVPGTRPARGPEARHAMTRSIPAVLFLILSVAAASPAAAHKLKVFATVDGDAVTGYAFFVGGGRAAWAPWTARQGQE